MALNFSKNVIVTVDRRGTQQRWVPVNENILQNVRRRVVQRARPSLVVVQANPRPFVPRRHLVVQQQANLRPVVSSRRRSVVIQADPGRIVPRRRRANPNQNVQRTPRPVFEPQLQRNDFRYTANDRTERYQRRQMHLQLYAERQATTQRSTVNCTPPLMMPRICIPNLTTSDIDNINRNLSARAQNVENIQNDADIQNAAADGITDEDDWAESFEWLFACGITGAVDADVADLVEAFQRLFIGNT